MNATEIHGALAERFGDAIIGFEEELLDPAIRVAPEKLREIAEFLKQESGLELDFLRCLSGVDRQDDGLEVVYHLLSYRHRHGVVLKTAVPADRAEVPTVSDIWRTAEWQERETWDLLGIRFTDHPDLRRIMLPDDWQGHPLRKDYVFPSEYHGITAERCDGLKSFDPPPEPAPDDGGLATPPAGGPATPKQPEAAQAGPWLHEPYLSALHSTKGEPIEGFLCLNMGPHHPATHGVLNFMLHTDGEILSRAIPDVGYLHRGIEKLAEMTSYPGFMPYTDRIDYLSAMTCNQAWAMAVEKLLELEVPRRAEYCRVIAAELNRIASHLVSTGCMAMDLGAYTPFIHWLRERETVNDIMEMICGARLTYNYMRIGGVSNDITPEIKTHILDWLDHFEPIIDEFNRLITDNEIYVKRLANVGSISREDAVSYGLVGPNLRASRVYWDIRRHEPYSVYPELEFDVVLGQAWRGTLGDCFDKYYCRIEEMRQSARILRQALDQMPEGEIMPAKPPRVIKPKANEAYARVEGARGELGMYVVADGSPKPYRARCRTGSFTAMSIIEHMSPGLMIADLVALIGALDIVAPEVDR